MCKFYKFYICAVVGIIIELYIYIYIYIYIFKLYIYVQRLNTEHYVQEFSSYRVVNTLSLGTQEQRVMSV